MTKHDSSREGAILGLTVATATWMWVAVVDALTARPFHTFNLLGGVVAFTAIHYLLNVLYGVVIVAALRGSQRTPSLFIALVFGLVMMEVAFAMLTATLAVSLGNLAWILIFGGSLIGMAIAVVVLNRRYPFGAYLERAEKERECFSHHA